MPVRPRRNFTISRETAFSHRFMAFPPRPGTYGKVRRYTFLPGGCPRGHGGRGGALSPGAVMSSCSLCRRTLVLLLAATLAASWASAAGPKARPVPKAAAPAHQDLLSRAWSLLASLWGEEGCHIDP